MKLREMLEKLAGVLPWRSDSLKTLPPVPPTADEIEGLVSRRPDVSVLPVLSLRDYREAMGGIPSPTSQQINDFALYVSGAKSWYKHLPLFPPGEPFTFFIDPGAGLDRILEGDGRVVYVNRTGESPRFHYTWMTTQEYRSRFGWLGFACAAGTELFLPVSVRLQDNRNIRGVFAYNPSRASLHLTEEMEYRLPPEIMDAGMVWITGVVHELSDRPSVWLRLLGNQPDPFPWPEETGGSQTSRKIADRCHTIQKEVAETNGVAEARRLNEIDKELALLLAPERRRLQQEMALAMNRVVSLVFGESV